MGDVHYELSASYSLCTHEKAGTSIYSLSFNIYSTTRVLGVLSDSATNYTPFYGACIKCRSRESATDTWHYIYRSWKNNEQCQAIRCSAFNGLDSAQMYRPKTLYGFLLFTLVNEWPLRHAQPLNKVLEEHYLATTASPPDLPHIYPLHNYKLFDN